MPQKAAFCGCFCGIINGVSFMSEEHKKRHACSDVSEAINVNEIRISPETVFTKGYGTASQNKRLLLRRYSVLFSVHRFINSHLLNNSFRARNCDPLL